MSSKFVSTLSKFVSSFAVVAVGVSAANLFVSIADLIKADGNTTTIVASAGTSSPNDEPRRVFYELTQLSDVDLQLARQGVINPCSLVACREVTFDDASKLAEATYAYKSDRNTQFDQMVTRTIASLSIFLSILTLAWPAVVLWWKRGRRSPIAP